MKTQMKKMLAILLTAAMLFSTNGFVFAAEEIQAARAEQAAAETAVYEPAMAEENTADEAAGDIAFSTVPVDDAGPGESEAETQAVESGEDSPGWYNVVFNEYWM